MRLPSLTGRCVASEALLSKEFLIATEYKLSHSNRGVTIYKKIINRRQCEIMVEQHINAIAPYLCFTVFTSDATDSKNLCRIGQIKTQAELQKIENSVRYNVA